MSRRPSLRLAVVGAGLLVAGSMLPLLWRATHTLKTCMTVTESYLKGEALRDYAFHLNDTLAHDTALVVQRPDRVDLDNRTLIEAQLRDKLLIAKLVRQACHAKCVLDHADSLQAVLRAWEAEAIDLASRGRTDEALDRIDAAEYHATTRNFVAALDEYALNFQRDVNEAVAAERAEEHAAIAWVVLILAVSVSLWFVLLRSVDSWKQQVVREVEERDLAQRELNASSRRYHELVDQIQDAMLLVDCESGRIVDANPAASELLGYTRDEVLASTMDGIESGAGPHTAATVDDDLVELEYRRRDGATLLVEVSRRRVRDRDRAAVLCLARDITRRRVLEARLAQAQQLECVGRVAAGVAHDLGNTLLAISAQTTVLRRMVRREGRESGGVDCIEAALEQATSVIKSLLSVADGTTVNPRDFDVLLTVRECLGFVDAVLPSRVNLVSMPLPEQPLWVHADPDRLQQALLNLVLNARDAMPNGGTIHLAVAAVEPSADQSPRSVEISIADTGHGIAPEIKESICEPFVTTKSSHGIGLGLFNVQRAMDECGGRLEVDSSPGEGAEFRLVLPLVPAPVAGKRTQAAGDDGRGVSVLLAESDDFAREVTAEALRVEGYRVCCVETSEQLLAALDEEWAGLVIVDSELQGGCGLECVDQVQRRAGAPPVILILGRSWREVEARVKEGTPVLGKPYTITALCRLARAIIAVDRSELEARA